MKLVVVIPALDEAETLPRVLADLPAEVPGLDEMETIVVDDGSSDGTATIAFEHGATRVVRFSRRRGLAEAFGAGIDAALRSGADVIVTVDADNQYVAADIPLLVLPILEGRADIVVGERYGAGVEEFSRLKRVLQRVGSATVRAASRTDVPDTTSGFRAYTREAALRINVLGRFTYTLESLIQAGRSGLAVDSAPVRTNPAVANRGSSARRPSIWRAAGRRSRALTRCTRRCGRSSSSPRSPSPPRSSSSPASSSTSPRTAPRDTSSR